MIFFFLKKCKRFVFDIGVFLGLWPCSDIVTAYRYTTKRKLRGEPRMKKQ